MLKKLHIILFLIFSFEAFSDQCADYLLLDGAEPLVGFGLDTTDHWWAITSPYQNMYRLHVDGESFDPAFRIVGPVFSPNSEDWSAIMQDNMGWYIIDQDSIHDFNATLGVEITYSQDGLSRGYTYKLGDEINSEEVIVINDTSFNVFNKVANSLELAFNYQGYAYSIFRNGKYFININGKESTLYDEVKQIGFFENGDYFYAARIGEFWQIYRNFDPISEYYLGLNDLQINPMGDVLAYSALLTSRYYVAVIIADDLNEAIESNRYSLISDVTLHPYDKIIMYNAVYNQVNFVCMNFTEFDAGLNNSKPLFSHDGEDSFFLTCRITCAMNVNGIKISTNNNYFLGREFAFAPGARSIAFTTNSGLVMRYVDNDLLYSGSMMDLVRGLRFNRFADRYEALGVINNRLYLLTCRE